MVKLNTPHFWHSRDEKQSSILKPLFLWPLSVLYRIGSGIHRLSINQKKSPLPVICIGNLTIGGAGKTPTARAILSLVKSHGKFATPCFLMRGYGGAMKGPIQVNVNAHTVWDVGDEALMQAQYAPVIIANDRYEGALLAEKLGYDLIIMDDGFQNPRLKKDISIIVVDGGFGFGNGFIFPAGPLRESVSKGIQRADAMLVIHRDKNLKLQNMPQIPEFEGKITLLEKGDILETKTVTAFAGIARPQKFFDALTAHGYKLYATYPYPDHHIYLHDELDLIVSKSTLAKVGIITTEKDWIRLSKSWREKISYLKISIDLDTHFDAFLRDRLDNL